MVHCPQCDLLVLVGFILAELGMIIEALSFKVSVTILASEGLLGCCSMSLSLIDNKTCLVVSYKAATRLSALQVSLF